MLRRAVELGVNHIDTAAFYFSSLRSANELINRALAPYPDGPGDRHEGRPRAGPVGRVAALGQARPAARPGRGEPAPARPRPPRRGEPPYQAAPVRSPSTSARWPTCATRGSSATWASPTSAPEHLAEARAIAPVVCVQNRYGIDSRRTGSDDLLRTCGEQGIAFVPFFAIAGEGRDAGSRGVDRPHPHRRARRCVAASPARTARRPRRSGWPGPSTAARTCWPSPAPATRTTSPRTWPRERSGSRPPNWPPWKPVPRDPGRIPRPGNAVAWCQRRKAGRRRGIYR